MTRSFSDPGRPPPAAWPGRNAEPERCWLCRARNLSICAASRPGDGDLLRELRPEDETLPAGGDLFVQGEPCGAVYTVLEGWVMLYELLPDGRRQILNFALPGAVLGFHRDAAAPMPYGAQALTPVRLCTVAADRLRPFLERHPAVTLQLAWLIERDEALAFAHLTSVGRRTARERLAHLLVELFLRVRIALGCAGTSIPLPLTQTHLGDALGLTPVHVNRTLRELRTDGLVELRQGRLTVPDLAALAAVAEMEIDPAAPLACAAAANG